MPDSFTVFLARRAVAAVAVSLAVCVLTFVTLHGLAPESAHDTQSLPLALAHYLRRVLLHGDFGRSTERPYGTVVSVLAGTLPADVSLLVGGMVAGLIGGLAGGMVCARAPRSLPARAVEGVAAVLLCAPVYFVGLLVILLFAPSIDPPLPVFLVVVNAYAPLTQDPVAWLHALVVPWFVVGAPLAAICLRMLRATLPEVAGEDFVRTARAKGLSPRAVSVRHTLPVALPATVSLAGAYTPLLIGNVILVEAVFGIPGAYRLIPSAIDTADFPLLQAIVIIGAVFVVLTNALADVTLAALDPRVRR
jgi:peptide/nickel transport system permease protein